MLEESHLSDAGPVMNNSHFVALPQSHSPLEFVPHGAIGAPGLLSLHNHTERSPLCRSDEKKLILVEDS